MKLYIFHQCSRAYIATKSRHLLKFGFVRFMKVSMVSERCIVTSKLFHDCVPLYNGLLRNLSVHLDGILKAILFAISAS